MADIETMKRHLVIAHKAGNTELAQRIADAIQSAQAPVEPTWRQALGVGGEQVPMSPEAQSSPIMRDFRTFPKSFAHAVKNAAVWLPNNLPYPLAPKEKPAWSDEELKAEGKAIQQDPNYGGVGDFAGRVAASLPLAAAAPIRGGFLLKSLGRAAAGAGQGAVFSDPGERTTNAEIGAIAGPIVGGLTDAAGWAGRTALPRAQRIATKLFRPSATESAAMEAQHGTVEEAGKKIIELGLARPGLSLLERRDAAQKLGGEAGAKIEAILDEAEKRGATVDLATVHQKIQDAIKDILYKPGTGTTNTVLSARNAANEYAERGILHPEVGLGPRQTGSNILKAAENQKQEVGIEGYLGPTRRYAANPEAAKADPEAKVLRKAYTAWKEGTEEGIDKAAPDLLAPFREAKDVSGVTQTFGPMAGRAGHADLAGSASMPHMRVSLHGPYINEGLGEKAMSTIRPRMIQGNQALDAIYNAIPPGTPPALRAALIELLRKKAEAQGAP